MKDYIAYANNLNASNKVLDWLNHNLVNFLKKNEENQEEIEHIIDFLVSDDAPVKMQQMSYPEAKMATEKWVKKLNKKAEKVVESPDDTEVVLDFKDGFKIVKLIGKNAYEREGYLMRHCVASYYGSGKTIYSLRDENNNPHCTMEEDQQVKGKGNGDIHPKYVGYVVKFLEHVGMTVGDSEMAHLGYINVEKIKEHLHKDIKLFNDEYVPENARLVDKKGNEFASLDLLNVKPLIKQNTYGEIKINFSLESFIELSIDFLFKKSKQKDVLVQSSNGDHSQLASSGYESQLASSGDYSKLASSGYCSQLASSGYGSQLASSGDHSQLASSGYYSKLASSGYCSQLASSGYGSQLASSGDYSKLASSGYYSQLASSGYCSQLASSGEYSRLEISGEFSVGANIGINGSAKGVVGSWITLAEYDDKLRPLCVKSAQIDGKELKPNTWYTLKNKKFTEVAND